MKKIFYLCFLFNSAIAISQEAIKFGVNTGITYSGIRGNEINNEKNKYGFDFLIGTSLNVPINGEFSFITGLNYERKTVFREIQFSKINSFSSQDPLINSSESGFKIKSTFNYLAIPINIKYYLGKNNSFFINGGLYTSLLLNKGNSFNILDLGANLGIGKTIKIDDAVILNIELRDNLGLLNIYSNTNTTNEIIKTNAINLILNWEFKI